MFVPAEALPVDNTMMQPNGTIERSNGNRTAEQTPAAFIVAHMESHEPVVPVAQKSTLAPKRRTTRSDGFAAKIHDEDYLGFYLRDISRFALVNAEQEQGLARAIEAGKDAAERLANEQIRSRVEKERLGGLVQDGVRAKEDFMRANLRLVVSVAKKYKLGGVEMLDLIQDGNIGLNRAVEKFDWRKGFKFSTYATWWIRQSINRSLANSSRNIRLPVHETDTVRRIKREIYYINREEPGLSDAEVMARLELSESDGDTWYSYLRTQTSSIDGFVSDDHKSTIANFVPDPKVEYDFAAVESGIRDKENIRTIGRVLTSRELEVLVMRLGLDGSEIQTLQEVGNHFDLSRERIRQIENKALTKLRHPSSGMLRLLA